MNGDCNLQAIASDGTTAWTANVGQLPQYSENGNCNEFLPDFQGGAVVKGETSTTQPNGQVNFQYYIQKFDGMTGQAYPAYNLQSVWWVNMNFQLSLNDTPWIRSYSPTVVHTDGTIFTIDSTGQYGENVVDLISPLTGQRIAQIGVGNGGVGNLMVAGDGYAYLPYVSYTGSGCPGIGITSLELLRMDTGGGSTSTLLGSWNTFCTAGGQSGTVAYPTSVNIITNADQGVLVSWTLETAPYSPNYGTETAAYYIAAVSGGSLMAQGTTQVPVQPILQAQDGTFYGTNTNTGAMIKFDRSGNIQWSVPGDYPQIATVDGGVVGASGITYDSNGNADGQIESTAPPLTNCPGGSCPVADLASFAQSWTQDTYQLGSVENTLTVPNAPATPPYASFPGANPSANGASPICHDSRDQLIAQYGQYAVLDSFFKLFLGGTPKNNNWPRFAPNCFELTSSAASANFSFSAISTGNPWALIKYPLVAAASMGYGLDDWFEVYRQNYGSLFGNSRNINSGYRTPAHNANLPYPGATSSRHMLGDAIDFGSATHTLQELEDMNDAALAAEADFVEDPAIMTTYCANGHPKSGPPYPCAHADWRYHSKGEYAH